MPDERTQDALDALADLFLTGLEPKAPSAAPAQPNAVRTPPAPPKPNPRPATAAAPAPRNGHVDGILDGPEPIRLGPTVRSPRPSAARLASHPPANPHAAPFGDPTLLDEEDFVQADARGKVDHLMDADGMVDVPQDTPAEAPYLRLRRDSAAEDDVDPSPAAAAVDLAPSAHTQPPRAATAPAPDSRNSDEDEDGPIPDRAAAPVLVEAVMLGNLPGLGGPWLAQYAQLLAQQDGPVAVLHVDDAGIDLELIDPPGAGAAVPAPHESPDLTDYLSSLIDAQDNPLRTILVHHDAVPEPAGLARLLSIDQWTFLCGADDMAVVGVYRTLKQIVDAAPDQAAARSKQVGLMIMGSDAPTSRAAARRVQSAAGSYLHTPVQLVGCQKRMQPVRIRQGGTYDRLDTLWPRLEALFNSFKRPDRADLDPARHPPLPASPRPELDEAPKSAAPPTPPVPGPAPLQPRADTASHALDDNPDLVELVAPSAIPGGVALQARCPRHPHTQLALDQNGRLHLLRRHTHAGSESRPARHEGPDQAPSPSDLYTLHAAALDLLEARNWVREHLQLLALTQRQLRFDPDVPPALHLLTPRADLATGLITRLGDTLALHLLHQVRVGDQSTWFCTPLS